MDRPGLDGPGRAITSKIRRVVAKPCAWLSALVAYQSRLKNHGAYSGSWAEDSTPLESDREPGLTLHEEMLLHRKRHEEDRLKTLSAATHESPPISEFATATELEPPGSSTPGGSKKRKDSAISESPQSPWTLFLPGPAFDEFSKEDGEPAGTTHGATASAEVLSPGYVEVANSLVGDQTVSAQGVRSEYPKHGLMDMHRAPVGGLGDVDPTLPSSSYRNSSIRTSTIVMDALKGTRHDPKMQTRKNVTISSKQDINFILNNDGDGPDDVINLNSTDAHHSQAEAVESSSETQSATPELDEGVEASLRRELSELKDKHVELKQIYAKMSASFHQQIAQARKREDKLKHQAQDSAAHNGKLSTRLAAAEQRLEEIDGERTGGLEGSKGAETVKKSEKEKKGAKEKKSTKSKKVNEYDECDVGEEDYEVQWDDSDAEEEVADEKSTKEKKSRKRRRFVGDDGDEDYVDG